MAATSSVPAVSARQWNTPHFLKAGRAALLVFDALLLVAILAGIRVHRDAIKTVGKDAAPSIISAQHIKSALAGMDVNAMDELLAAPNAGGSAVQLYEAERVEAADALLSAAENITYGASERAPIQTLEIGLGAYERLIQKARDLREADRPETIPAYRDAVKLLDETLLPATDALDRANQDVLEHTYGAQSTNSFAARALVTLSALLSLGMLLIVQVFLSRRLRRTFNPLLLLATLLTLGLTVWALAAMGEEQEQLKIAKQDAFTSIHALWRARALAYEARGDETRSLLDPGRAAEDQSAFTRHAGELATLPPSMTASQMVAQLGSGARAPELSGYLADELNNTTFPGEREAALATFASFEQYAGTDAEVARLELAGRPKQALELCLGAAPGQSKQAFEEFDRSLGITLAINQRAFDQSVERGFATLKSAEIKASGTALLTAILIFLGFAPRMREYM